MSCGHNLAWYDLFPLFSYLSLGGKCRYCKKHISAQYPIVEFTNGVFSVLSFMLAGFWLNDLSQMESVEELILKLFITVLSASLCSALLVVTVIDWRTFEIPLGANIFILVIGTLKFAGNVLIHGFNSVWLDVYGFEANWFDYVIGFFVVSIPLALIYYISKGRAIGGGDVKLMAVAGLFLGWKLALVALIAGCLYGSVIHIIRMKVSGEGKQLAMGPYLSAGIVTALWFGSYIVEWYSGFFPS